MQLWFIRIHCELVFSRIKTSQEMYREGSTTSPDRACSHCKVFQLVFSKLVLSSFPDVLKASISSNQLLDPKNPLRSHLFCQLYQYFLKWRVKRELYQAERGGKEESRGLLVSHTLLMRCFTKVWFPTFRMSCFSLTFGIDCDISVIC